MRQISSSKGVAALVGALLLLLLVTPAHAQHSDWLLGSNGLLAGQQAPEGIYYQNLWSYYHAGGDSFTQTGAIKCGPRGRLCLSLNAGAQGNLDSFVDQNIFVYTTPLKILGANYGFFIDVPFVIVSASDAAALEPVLTSPVNSRSLLGQQSGGSTKGSIGNMYVEPLNLGWHFKQLDAVVSSGFFAPSGPYNANAKLNIGLATGRVSLDWAQPPMPMPNALGRSRSTVIICSMRRRWDGTTPWAMRFRSSGAPAKP